MKLSSLKILLKKKKLLSFQRKFRIWVFVVGILKKLLPFSKSVPSNFPICEVSCRTKQYLHLGQKMMYLGILRQEFEKVIVIFETNTLELVLSVKFSAKQKFLNLGGEMPYLGNFGLKVKNNIVIFEISTLEFF